MTNMVFAKRIKLRFDTKMRLTVLLLLLVEFSTPGTSGERESDKAKSIHFNQGSVEFEAPVNIKALTIHGKSNQVEGSLLVDGLRLTDINIRIPVNSLSTGMKVRDKHMRERIFQTEDGELPDIEFYSSEANCTGQTDNMECEVKGFLKIRSLPKEVSIPLRVTYKGGKYQASGETVIKLTEYDISPPSQFGVKMQNIIIIRFEVSGND